MSKIIISYLRGLFKTSSLHLSGSERSVLRELSELSDRDGKGIEPSHEYIAKMTGLSISTVQRCLRSLENKKLIWIENRFEQGFQITNAYTINVEGIKSLVDTEKQKKLEPPYFKRISKIDNLVKTVDNSVDNHVYNSKTLEPSRVVKLTDKSLDHLLYKKINYEEGQVRKSLIAELLSLHMYMGEVIRLIGRYGVEKILQMKEKIVLLIRESKITVRNFGAYLRQALKNDEKGALKPLQEALKEKIKVNVLPSLEIKRQAPQDFKNICQILSATT